MPAGVFIPAGRRCPQGSVDARRRLRPRRGVGVPRWDDNEKWADRVSFLYLWYSYPEQGISLPFFSREIGKMAHLESFEIKMCGEKDRLSTHPLNIILRHETSIILPEHGFIKGKSPLAAIRKACCQVKIFSASALEE